MNKMQSRIAFEGGHIDLPEGVVLSAKEEQLIAAALKSVMVDSSQTAQAGLGNLPRSQRKAHNQRLNRKINSMLANATKASNGTIKGGDNKVREYLNNAAKACPSHWDSVRTRIDNKRVALLG